MPVHVTYEGLSADPAGTLAHVLDHLGLDGSIAKGIAPQVAKLADQTSRQWVERFLSDRPLTTLSNSDRQGP